MVARTGQPAPAVSPNGTRRRQHNLPAPPSAIVGREAELAAVRGRLLRPDVRMVTLTGAPGAGKTRLALEAATSLVDAFPDGVWLVRLDTVRERERVLPAIAHTLGVREAGAQPLDDALIAYLEQLHTLLVLDNFEQVLEAAPDVAGLLERCPAVALLVTSRAPLRLRAEHEIAVEPLDTGSPTAGYGLKEVAGLPSGPASGVHSPPPAVQLFVARAQAVRAGFTLTDENVAAVAAICERLDGLPLAIELAAARVKLFSPRALLDRLEPRLDLLTGGARDLPERHQTLRAAIAWSYDLLSPADQAVFRALGVFSGGCTIEAAAAVCVAATEQGAPVEEIVAALLDHSLVT